MTSRRPPIIAYTDGSCVPNPGPAGIGVVLICEDKRKEISEYIGEATNNVAELSAILRALTSIKDRSRQVTVHSDSEYAIGMLTKSWRPKANRALVEELRAVAKTFANLSVAWVPAHSGVPENERCDELAKNAIEERATR